MRGSLWEETSLLTVSSRSLFSVHVMRLWSDDGFRANGQERVLGDIFGAKSCFY